MSRGLTQFYDILVKLSIVFFVNLSSRMNDQMKPITDLLRETENINLAPEILEPETQSIQKVHVCTCMKFELILQCYVYVQSR